MQELVQNNKKYQKYILSKFKRTLRKTRRRREKKDYKKTHQQQSKAPQRHRLKMETPQRKR
jgi:hypothetical protein